MLFTRRSEYPCADQSANDIESYYRSVKPGSEVAIRETHGGILRYYLSTVDKLNRGRIYPLGHQSFFAKSGSMCRAPHGQSNLVIPSDAVKAYAEVNPSDPSRSYSRYVPATAPPTLDEARQKLAAAEAKLHQLNERWDSYSGNNPNKYRSSIRTAQAEVSSLSDLVRILEAQAGAAPADS